MNCYGIDAPRSRAVVLVVDRSLEDLEAAREHLRSECIVLTARSASGALELAAQEPCPDLVLLGCLVPDADGAAVLAGLRRDERTRSVPVVASGPQAECEGLARRAEGTADFIPKPWTAPVLQTRLRTHIELKRLREELSQRNCALQQEVERRSHLERTLQVSAADLGRFSGGVSLDLRAPASAISNCADSLLAEQASLSAKGRQGLERIVAASRRMNRTIEDVLRYSLAGQSDMRVRCVDLSVLAAEVLADLGAQAAAQVVVDPLPVVRGDPAMLGQVLAHLIGNALKFSGARSGAQLQIRARTAAGLVEVSVRDNGAGFDMGRRDKLFGLFQRLHAETEFPGSGVGLAIVKRLVVRQGGTVSADSVPGGWTTFRFTLPAAHAQPHGASSRCAVCAGQGPAGRTPANPAANNDFLAPRSRGADPDPEEPARGARRP